MVLGDNSRSDSSGKGHQLQLELHARFDQDGLTYGYSQLLLDQDVEAALVGSHLLVGQDELALLGLTNPRFCQLACGISGTHEHPKVKTPDHLHS